MKAQLSAWTLALKTNQYDRMTITKQNIRYTRRLNVGLEEVCKEQEVERIIAIPLWNGLPSRFQHRLPLCDRCTVCLVYLRVRCLMPASGLKLSTALKHSLSSQWAADVMSSFHGSRIGWAVLSAGFGEEVSAKQVDKQRGLWLYSCPVWIIALIIMSLLNCS